MRYKEFNLMQMERLGYENPTDHEVELFSVLGPKLYNRLITCGFNVAYAERTLHQGPVEDSYQRDMLFNQNLITSLAHQRMCVEKTTNVWLKEFLDNFSEVSCLEAFREAIAFQRLDDVIKGNDQKLLK